MTSTHEAIKTDTCSKCGRVENIDLLDGKDDGSGDYTQLQCIACYGDEWLPAVSIVIDDVHCTDLIPHYAAFAINSEKRARAELYAARDQIYADRKQIADLENAVKSLQERINSSIESRLRRLVSRIPILGSLLRQLRAAAIRALPDAPSDGGADMKKIPTLFERDWKGDRSRVVDQVNPLCHWVLDGKGVATRKIDGTCCLIRDGKLYKRRELRQGEEKPAGYEQADFDPETQKEVGWVPIGDGPEDRWHREALDTLLLNFNGDHGDGTYELIGPKIQGNPENVGRHLLIKHGFGLGSRVEDVPRDFGGIREYLRDRNIEGIVWHHSDGRMAKIKLRDFGLKRVRGGTAPSDGGADTTPGREER